MTRRQVGRGCGRGRGSEEQAEGANTHDAARGAGVGAPKMRTAIMLQRLHSGKGAKGVSRRLGLHGGK